MKLALVVFFIRTIASATEEGINTVAKDGIEDISAIIFPKDFQGHQRCNEVQSGFAVLPILALLCLAATGETHLELHESLGFANQKYIIYQAHSNLKTLHNVTLTIANRVYVTNNVTINRQFAESLTPRFGAEIQSIDFLNVVNASTEINNWFDNKTEHNITNILSPNDLNPNTSIVAVSAIYFHGNWEHAFDEKKSAEIDFHVFNGKSVKVVAMHKMGVYKYLDSKILNSKILELPYSENNTAMYIILPNAIDEFYAIEEKLTDRTVLSAEIREMTTHRVKICLPKFRIETKTCLTEPLENLNIKQIFNATSANLRNMLENENEHVYVNHIIQKSVIEVCENGVNNETVYNNPDHDIEVEFRACNPFFLFVKMDDDYILGGVYTGQD